MMLIRPVQSRFFPLMADVSHRPLTTIDEQNQLFSSLNLTAHLLEVLDICVPQVISMAMMGDTMCEISLLASFCTAAPLLNFDLHLKKQQMSTQFGSESGKSFGQWLARCREDSEVQVGIVRPEGFWLRIRSDALLASIVRFWESSKWSRAYGTVIG